MTSGITPILELVNVHKVFPGVHALKGVSFDVRPGEVHALLGENGAGKSTLIKLLSGVHAADEGQLLVDGALTTFSSPAKAQAAGVATIYQELGLYPELTVAENIFMGHAPTRGWGPLRWVNWAAMETRAAELLAALDVHDLDVRRLVGTLNVGNRQRVEIAKALSQDARVLIMDEPTAALTEADVERLFHTVRLLKARGVSVVYISHRLQEVFALADRVTVLRDGAHVGTLPVSEVDEAALIAMMVGRKLDALYPKQDSVVGDVMLDVQDLVSLPHTRGVSFQVRAGEIVGLAGLVGSGRSETAQAIFGVLPMHSGAVTVAGRRVSIRKPSDAIAQGVAYVPEDRGLQGLVRPMSIRANSSMAVLRRVAWATFLRPAREQALAWDTIEALGIRATGPHQTSAKLSGGNQQKVVVGKWLAANPRVLIVDEPTRGVDVGAKAEIHRRMSQLAAEQGLAILMISSELPEILGMSDRVLVMREGRIVAEYDRAEATQERIVGAMMGEQQNTLLDTLPNHEVAV